MNHNVYLSLKIDEEIKKWLIKEGKYNGEAKKSFDAINIEHKREYRKKLKERHDLYYRPYGRKPAGVITASGGEYEYGWMKVFFEGEHWADEEKQEFIEDNWEHYIPSQYDCTGQVFTTGIYVFNVPRGVVVYIKEAMDV